MRPLAQPASALYQPLDSILGTPAAIRILRVLCRHGGVLSPTTIADRARINRSGSGRTLTQLVTAGIVEVVGQGRYVSYRLADAHPLARVLTELFRREAERAEAVFSSVRKSCEEMAAPPRAVWLLGQVARGVDEVGDAVELAVVGDEPEVHRQADRLRAALAEVAREWAVETTLIVVTPEKVLQWMTQRDPFWMELERDAAPLYGATPRQVARGAPAAE